MSETPLFVERIDFAPGGVPQKMAKKATEEERKMCGGVGGVGGLCEVAQPLGPGQVEEEKHWMKRGIRVLSTSTTVVLDPLVRSQVPRILNGALDPLVSDVNTVIIQHHSQWCLRSAQSSSSSSHWHPSSNIVVISFCDCFLISARSSTICNIHCIGIVTVIVSVAQVHACMCVYCAKYSSYCLLLLPSSFQSLLLHSSSFSSSPSASF